jgi:EpsI family protein
MPRAIILSAFLLGGAISIELLQNRHPLVAPFHEAVDAFPAQLGTWIGGPQLEMTIREIEMLRVETYIKRRYVQPNGKMVELYIGYHPEGGYHSPLNCMPGHGWNIADKKFVSVSVQSPDAERTVKINRITFTSGLEKQVGLYWYKTCGRIVASEYWSLIYGIYDKMRLRRTDAALIRVMSPAESLEASAEEEAGRRAVEFARLVLPLLSRYVPE